MRRALAIIAVGAALACHHAAQAQTTAGCQVVTSTASSAAEDEIQFLRNNVRKPQSVNGLTCLTLLESATALSADMIVNTIIEQVLNAIVGQICNALTNYWQAVLNELKCGISVGGPGLGFPGLGGLGAGTVCQFNIGNTYGTRIQLGAGIGPGGGGFYINGQTVQVDAYSQ
jgi:hypothetical protein